MIRENNGWICSNEESMQYYKPLGNRVFQFIEAIWLDTAEGDTRAENAKDKTDNYCVVSSIIDLKEMDNNDIECAICGFYNDVSEIEKTYGKDCVDQIIAECAFCNSSSFDNESKVLSKSDSEKEIQSFIDNN